MRVVGAVHARNLFPPPPITTLARAGAAMPSYHPLDYALEEGPSREAGTCPGRGTPAKTRLAGVAMMMFGAALVVGPSKIQESAHRRMTQLNAAVGLVLPGT